MILGNKCDMESKRAVSKEKGEAVSHVLDKPRSLNYRFCEASEII